jgi:hypothetical protein
MNNTTHTQSPMIAGVACPVVCPDLRKRVVKRC